MLRVLAKKAALDDTRMLAKPKHPRVKGCQFCLHMREEPWKGSIAIRVGGNALDACDETKTPVPRELHGAFPDLWLVMGIGANRGSSPAWQSRSTISVLIPLSHIPLVGYK